MKKKRKSNRFDNIYNSIILINLSRYLVERDIKILCLIVIHGSFHICIYDVTCKLAYSHEKPVQVDGYR